MCVFVCFFFLFAVWVVLVFFFFFSSRRRHTRWSGDWSSDVCSSDLGIQLIWFCWSSVCISPTWWCIIVDYDGVFLSNGPGDPSICDETICNIQTALQQENKPVFGICLGHQLLSRAAGCKTYKLPWVSWWRMGYSSDCSNVYIVLIKYNIRNSDLETFLCSQILVEGCPSW